MTRAVWACLTIVALSREVAAQTAYDRATMARADSAWKSGDRVRARALYAEIYAADSTASRAVFRLAQLNDSDERALALYRRYIALEPDDAWGHMAEGDLLARMGRVEEALVAYEGAHAIAPEERDVAFGRARLLDRAGRPHQATDELGAWTSANPDDGEAWDLMGRVQMRAGRPRAAAAAFVRADRLGVPGARTRLRNAHAAAAPSVTPEAVSLGDSDGNRTARFGGSVDLMIADGTRVGAGGARGTVGNDVGKVSGTDLDLRIAATPSALVRLSAAVGIVRYDGLAERAPSPVEGPGQAPGQAPGQGPPIIPQGRTREWNTTRASARVRIRAPGQGPSLDLRLERAPVGFSPLLVENHVERLESRLTVELPLAALRLRGIGRFGHLEAMGEAPNGRTSLEGAVVYPLGARLQPSLQYRRAGFTHASTAGYFAPRLAETIEAGAYLESSDDGPLTISADAGAGMQRVTPHGGLAGSWSRVWRAWAQAALAMGPGRAWFVELEAYDAPFALEGAAATGSWRFLSVSSGLRLVIR